MNKLAKTRKFVSDHRVILAYCAGCLVTGTATYYLQGGNVTLLKLTKEHAQLLKDGGTVVYELKDQTINLINIPAVEALTAAV